jgi:deazaflavin-dependent oxidoreductase (nitroreductase family)
MPLPHAVARFNKKATNRVTIVIAGRMPGFGIITHRGRRSGRIYRTPVNLFRQPGGFAVALTYGRGDWVKNALAAGQVRIRTRGRDYTATNPRVSDQWPAGLPPPVRAFLKLLHVGEFLWVDR